MSIIRTPDERFANLPGYPYQPHYAEVNPHPITLAPFHVAVSLLLIRT